MLLGALPCLPPLFRGAFAGVAAVDCGGCGALSRCTVKCGVAFLLELPGGACADRGAASLLSLIIAVTLLSIGLR